jgi:REP element-mobilizing transposase RayT
MKSDTHPKLDRNLIQAQHVSQSGEINRLKELTMPKPRYAQVSLDATPYYHCVSRCVRRAFLCGVDDVSGQSYEHRRQWIEDKLLELAGIFALDVCAYAVMSNHYHVVLHIDNKAAQSWGFDEVIERWHRLFSGNHLSQRHCKGDKLGKAEQRVLEENVAQWRQRLADISWYMRVLNESIARQANDEDQCTGRFWEGRFKSQALLDESALAACMAYVDLNPIRAGMAKMPETSKHTSVRKRMKKMKTAAHPNQYHQQVKNLFPFAGNSRENMPNGLPFRLTDYLELVDWSGRVIREDKRGFIPKHLPPILERLNMDASQWLYLSQNFESPFKGLVGAVQKLKKACQALGYERMPGRRSCEQYFP